jgi:hypothetical protein
MSEVFDIHQNWLQILREIPLVLTMMMTNKDQAKYYALFLPQHVQQKMLDEHGPQKSVAEMWEKAQEVGQQCINYYHIRLQEKAVAGNRSESWKLQKNHEAGSYKANLAAVIQPFTPAYGACFHCNQKGHTVNDSACTNTADPETHYGLCGNDNHPCLGGICPKRNILLASKSGKQASMAVMENRFCLNALIIP